MGGGDSRENADSATKTNHNCKRKSHTHPHRLTDELAVILPPHPPPLSLFFLYLSPSLSLPLSLQIHTQPSKSVSGGPVGDDSFTPTATPKAASSAPTVKLIPLELLRCEEAFYWRCLCHYLHGKGIKGDEWLENIVPTITEMCDYIER